MPAERIGADESWNYRLYAANSSAILQNFRNDRNVSRAVCSKEDRNPPCVTVYNADLLRQVCLYRHTSQTALQSMPTTDASEPVVCRQ